jgi:large subunit ribosomal protein L9
MEVILLERIAKLGQMGDEVKVKDGYARNYLLPQGKALRANKANRERFERERAQLEARNLEQKTEAEAVGAKLEGESYIAIRSAGDSGQLYGSVSTRDIADLVTAGGFSLERNQVALNQPIKTLGIHPVVLALHPEVEVTVTLNVARSQEEAERQARGEDMTQRREDEEEEAPAIEELMEDEERAREAAAELEANGVEAEDTSEAAEEESAEEEEGEEEA